MVKTKVTRASISVHPTVFNAIGALCRYGLAAMWLVSGTIKMRDPMGFRQSVQAYELFSPRIEGWVATLLPPTEVALGLLLLLGLYLRGAALVTGLMMLGFMAGISSAWARGLAIDCGCFSTDHSSQSSSHGVALVRDLLFLGMSMWVIWRPWRKWAMHP